MSPVVTVKIPASIGELPETEARRQGLTVSRPRSLLGICRAVHHGLSPPEVP